MDTSTDFYSQAIQYRTGLDKLYKIVSSNLSCACEYRKNWVNLMDIGVPYNSPSLREDDVICTACQVEYAYADAIGEDVFTELCLAQLAKFFSDRFKDPIMVSVEDDDGNIEPIFMEKDDYERLLAESDDQ